MSLGSVRTSVLRVGALWAGFGILAPAIARAGDPASVGVGASTEVEAPPGTSASESTAGHSQGADPSIPVAAVGMAPSVDEDIDAGEPSDDSHAHLMMLAVRGAFLRAHQRDEGGADRGAVGLTLGVHAIPEMLVAVAYEDNAGGWSYAFAESSSGDSGPARASAFEHRHRIDLGADYDLLVAAARLHVVPYLGLAYLGLASQAFRTSTFALGGGLGIAHDADSRTKLEASLRVLQGLTKSATAGSLFGEVRTLWTWRGGVSLGDADAPRVGIAYVGDAFVRAHGTRYGHGAEFSLSLSFL